VKSIIGICMLAEYFVAKKCQHTERATESAQTEVVRQDYLTRSCALTSRSKHSFNFNRMFEEHQIFLSL
jgi:hypothetical protein